ncbi:MAG: hypothetical protein ACOYMA_02120 [Bacteroidia bacterium]
MKNNSKIKIALFVLVLSAMSFIAHAQKNMWTGNSYVFNINSATNVTSTIAWNETTFSAGTLTAGSEGLSGTRNSIYTNAFANSSSGVQTCSLTVTETVNSCDKVNTLSLSVYPTPTFTANSIIPFCAALGSAPGTLDAVVANFTNIKGITSIGQDFTLTYQLYDNSNVPVSGGGATGTLTLAAGSSASTGTVSLSGAQIAALYAILNAQAAGTYNLKIKAFTTPATPTSTEAGAVTSIATTPITIQPFTINAIPTANPIIAN